MKKILLLMVLALFILTSVLARADNYAKQRSQIFVLEKNEYLDDMYKYLVCLLNIGDKGDRNVNAVTAYCKSPHIQNLVLQDTKPTDQKIYSSLKPYGFDLQTMILCLAEGGARTSRATTAMVIAYCDKVVQPLD